MALDINTEFQIFRPEKLQQYYRFQSKIYDATRWSFLFGRKTIIDKIPALPQQVKSILEIGCGTGHNLVILAKKYPNAKIIGIDISEDMIAIAKKTTKNIPNIEIQRKTVSDVSHLKYDVILCSYVLTMINPGWESIVNDATNLLNSNGYFAVVDFHNTRFNWFRKHMTNHNVTMKKQILPVLKKHFTFSNETVISTYWGLWEYFYFVGNSK